ncbi:hypothetical protein CORC01_02752 [Colletotrichum orchidophilum]|uniref:Uncharacterized protein n=1 Tax=Colletotrichum orchidophilum TaxID=1209926 RepID=A0A1G4BKD0_9PEZI|nr:uncharacterized protein CORC01_02752 [Colletotrichum orchidophilum]OHF01874.1 hypothetical protein CORC01_02752 [Colletotrichum orchidophilum]
MPHFRLRRFPPPRAPPRSSSPEDHHPTGPSSLSVFFCLFRIQNPQESGMVSMAKILTTRQVQPSQAAMSTALVTPSVPNHTLSVGTMTECPFLLQAFMSKYP